MIDRKDIYKIGVFNKPHGVNGELQFTFTDDIFDRVDCDFLICMIDGIPVPFFVEEYRIRSGTTALVKLDGVDDACPCWRGFGRRLFASPLSLIGGD